MLIQRNDNKRKANGNLHPHLTLGEVCLTPSVCSHYTQHLGYTVRKQGLACLEASLKTFAELAWGFASVGTKQFYFIIFCTQEHYTVFIIHLDSFPD